MAKETVTDNHHSSTPLVGEILVGKYVDDRNQVQGHAATAENLGHFLKGLASGTAEEAAKVKDWLLNGSKVRIGTTRGLISLLVEHTGKEIHKPGKGKVIGAVAIGSALVAGGLIEVGFIHHKRAKKHAEQIEKKGKTSKK